ncbi:MAG: YfiR family protein [Pseudomonadota bacterium]
MNTTAAAVTSKYLRLSLPPASTSLVSLWFLLLTLLTAATASAQEASAEYQLKAAFLFKFPLYVEWPAQTFAASDSPLVFGVMASEPMFIGLQELAEGRTVDGHMVSVQRLQPDAALTSVHVLFIGSEFGDATPALLQQAVSRAILTVTEASTPVPADSMINFNVSEDRVRFDIATAPARAAGLTLSSRLLQVAQTVRETR